MKALWNFKFSLIVVVAWIVIFVSLWETSSNETLTAISIVAAVPLVIALFFEALAAFRNADSSDEAPTPPAKIRNPTGDDAIEPVFGMINSPLFDHLPSKEGKIYDHSVSGKENYLRSIRQ